MRVLAISGSLRRASYNTALLNAASELAPAGLDIDLASIEAVPLYNADVESESGVPEAVESLKARLTSARGLLLATPEYNQGIPGVLKNSLDWLTRPPGDVKRIFRGKLVGVIGATPGAGGTRMAQAAWLPVLHALGLQIYSGHSVLVPKANEAFDAQGRLVDERLRSRLESYMGGFSEMLSTLDARA